LTPLCQAKITFEQLLENSEAFDKKTPFPTSANRIKNIAKNKNDKDEIIEQANSVRPIFDQSVIKLIEDFLEFKKQSGSTKEKALYASMDRWDFIDRLIEKRPLMFMTEFDQYLLRNGKSGSGGFDSLGTKNEKAPLLLEDYLSYDEMQIAAFIGISCPTFFINDGDRFNKAQPGKQGTFEPEGVYTGLVGARFEKPDRMEWQHMIITPKQKKTPLLSIWSDFYGEGFATFKQAQKDKTGRYISVGYKKYLDTTIYKKRIRKVVEPFLVDAHKRGKEAKKKVYCHAVGLGLGVWQVSPLQAKLMLDVYADILQERNLSHIADIDFSWFPAQYQKCGGVGNLEVFETEHNSITIHFSKRNPAEKLVGDDAGKLLVAMYAWDGNAYPGNEYWDEMLTASGDPAAASCSTIPELQNPLINKISAKESLIVKKRAAPAW